jgi:predicted ATPase
MLGSPEAAFADVHHALRDAREIGHAATTMYALFSGAFVKIFCRDYAAASLFVDELIALADEKDASYWQALGKVLRGRIRSLCSPPVNATQAINTEIKAYRLTGSTIWMPWFLLFLVTGYSDDRKFDDAWRCIDEALATMGTSKERCCEAEVNRVAGELTLIGPKPDVAKAEAYLKRALEVARQQQAKSWELRAAMSMARLWRDQGKRDAARDLLAPVYAWFTEGFDTLDLKEAKALLDELHD